MGNLVSSYPSNEKWIRFLVFSQEPNKKLGKWSQNEYHLLNVLEK